MVFGRQAARRRKGNRYKPLERQLWQPRPGQGLRRWSWTQSHSFLFSLRPREVKSLALSHTAARLQAQDFSVLEHRQVAHNCLHLQCIFTIIWGAYC